MEGVFFFPVRTPGTGNARTVLRLACIRLGFSFNAKGIVGSTLTSVPDRDSPVYKSKAFRRSREPEARLHLDRELAMRVLRRVSRLLLISFSFHRSLSSHNPKQRNHTTSLSLST
jgi:hypothetical protein